MREIYLESVDSTTIYAKKTPLPANEIICIHAGTQTAGRGRFDRTWISPPNLNLLATFCFRLPLNTLHLSSLGQVMATTVATLLTAEGLKPAIKWPNDIQLNGKKVCGVLCETSIGNDIEIYLSVGLNVNMTDFSHIDQPATSLQVETSHPWDIRKLLTQLQAQFSTDLATFKQNGFAPFYPLFDTLLLSKGKTIRCFDGKTTWTGICDSLNPDGSLNLRLENGQIHPLYGAEIKS